MMFVGAGNIRPCLPAGIKVLAGCFTQNKKPCPFDNTLFNGVYSNDRDMTRRFVMMPEFDRQWQKLDLGDDELRRLQESLLQKPKAGGAIRGTKGLRKIRIAFEGQGKSGGGRVVYIDFAAYETIYLITAYPKNEKENLSQAERNAIAKMVVRLEQGLKDQGNVK
jgi:hypothetical protein